MISTSCANEKETGSRLCTTITASGYSTLVQQSSIDPALSKAEGLAYTFCSLLNLPHTTHSTSRSPSGRAGERSKKAKGRPCPGAAFDSLHNSFDLTLPFGEGRGEVKKSQRPPLSRSGL